MLAGHRPTPLLRASVVIISALTLDCVRNDNIATQEGYTVAFGVMEPSNHSATVGELEETRTIRMNGRPEPGFSFIVDPPNNEPYDVYSVHYLPGRPDTLYGDFADQEHNTGSVVRTRTRRVDGVHRFDFGFSPGDPIGLYRIDIFVNSVLTKTIEFEVLEASAGR